MHNKRSLVLMTIALLFSLATSAQSIQVPEQSPAGNAGNPSSASVPFSLNSQAASSASVPDHVLYRHLFRKIAAFRERAEEWDRQGKNGNALRYLVHRQAGLVSSQAAAFDEILQEYELKAVEKDEQAHRIIEAYRAQYPNGRVPHGEKLAPIPSQLKVLQAERDAITLHAIERLKSELGPVALARLDAYARQGFRQRSLSPAPTQ